jgi:hypothetical protein
MVFGLFLTGVVYRLLERKHALAPTEFAASARSRRAQPASRP